VKQATSSTCCQSVEKKIQMVLPIFFEAINVAFAIEVKGEFFKVLVQVISELLLQTIAENEKHN
jgi:hypothetical protein